MSLANKCVTYNHQKNLQILSLHKKPVDSSFYAFPTIFSVTLRNVLQRNNEKNSIDFGRFNFPINQHEIEFYF